MSLRIRRLSYALGAEVRGIDIRASLDDATVQNIRRAFLEHGILLFRGQHLTAGQHVAFSRRFGELLTNDDNLSSRHSEFPEVLVVKSKPGATSYVGEYWHTDRNHECTPPLASILRAVEIPDVGGDTMFANTYLGYDTLTDGMKKLAEGLYGIHVGGGRHNRLAGTQLVRRAAQPIVRVHPETGRKALYLTEIVDQLVGMTVEESRPLLEFLCRHTTRPQFVYRHQWQKDDLVMWDNCCVLHNALGDYDHSLIRHMERTTVMGTGAPSGYVL
jgi:taurine dioxygenase